MTPRGSSPGGRTVLALVLVAALVGIGCADDEPRVLGPVTVERVAVTGERPPTASVAALSDDTLLTVPQGYRTSFLFASHDGGRTWAPAELPERPAELGVTWQGSPLLVHDVAVFAGHDQAPASSVLPVGLAGIHVWTSDDATTWRLHRLDTDTPVTGHPRVVAAGDLLVVVTDQIDGLVVHTSDDRGTRWRRARVDGTPPAAAGGEVRAVPLPDGGLGLFIDNPSNVRPQRFLLESTDAGRSWRSGRCDDRCPFPGDADETWLGGQQVTTDGGRTFVERDVVPVREQPNGGPQLGRISTGSEEVTVSHLVRRTGDGRWEEVLAPQGCGDLELGATIGEPLVHDQQWYVSLTCGELVPDRTSLFRSPLDGAAFEPVAGADRRGATYGPPAMVGRDLLFPELDRSERLVAVTRVGPT